MIRIHLDRLLGERRMTQKQLSDLTGIRPATINAMYHEMAQRVQVDHLDLICEALGCQLHELIDYQPNKVKIAGTQYVIRRTRAKKTP